MKDILKDDAQLESLLPPGFDPHQAMSVLAGYIRGLETSFTEFRQAAMAGRRQLEGEQRALTKLSEDQKQEIERLTADLMELTGTIEEQESQLATCNHKIAGYEVQSKKLHRDNGELRAKLTQKENDADFFRQEAERNRQEADASAAAVVTANNRLEDLERKIATMRDGASACDKEVRRLSLALSESQDKNALTEQRLSEIVAKYNEEIRRLNERNNADAQHEAALLKKRVRSGLVPEMRDMEKLALETLSIETASNYKALLNRFVAKLEQAGLELK